jgi:hypothetical protein
MKFSSYKEIFDLIKEGATFEAQDKIMAMRASSLELQEENFLLKEQIHQLKISKKALSSPIDAYKKTISIVSNITALLVIFSAIIKINEIFYWIAEHPILSLILIFLLIAIYIANLLNLLKVKTHWPPTWLVEVINRLQIFFKKKLVIIGGILTGIALIIVVYIFVFFSAKGIHYVWIASYNEQKAYEVVEEIKKKLNEAGLNDIQVTSYSSTPPNPYRSIIIGGPHFSKKSAEKTFNRAKPILQNYIAKNPKIISYFVSKPKEFSPL